MKITFKVLNTSAVLTAIFCALLSSDTNAELNYVKIMSFNVRTSYADDGPSNWWNRIRNVEEALNRHDPDIIGTQETTPDQVSWLSRRYRAIGDTNPTTGERTGIFYKESSVIFLEGRTFALASDPNAIGSKFPGMKYARAPTWARFQTKNGGIVCFMNAHFDIAAGFEDSVLLVTQTLMSNCEMGDVIIFGGDLNTVPDTLAIRYLYGETDIHGKWNPLPMVEALENPKGFTEIGLSFNGIIGNTKKIDYLMVHRNIWLCVQSGKILPEIGVSDHALLMTQLCLGDGCGGCLISGY
jgi:endonuclease/exonuclease/phosphatase family metal-dependent hydrolase